MILAVFAALTLCTFSYGETCFTYHGYMNDSIAAPYPTAAEGIVQLVKPATGNDPEVILQNIEPDPSTGYYEVTPVWDTGVTVGVNGQKGWYIRAAFKYRWNIPPPAGSWWYSNAGSAYVQSNYKFIQENCTGGGGLTIYDLDWAYVQQ